MSDVFSKRKRSQVMQSVRGKGNRSTEGRIRHRLASSGLSGWHLHATGIIGKPDFAFPKERVAVFIDGCFWHGCKTCRNLPATNREFWAEKIRSNKLRDRIVTSRLRRDGWAIIRFWEHDVRLQANSCVSRIHSIVRDRSASASYSS